MAAYYNEIDPFAAAWLRELIKAGAIADGEVDERSIELVRPDDLRGFAQCHFFAGIGGWSYALRLAGWPDDRPVWTASSPCQPWSQVNPRRRRTDDGRDLWPVFWTLASECRPSDIFGEQVSGGDGLQWLDRARASVEAEGYAFAAVDLVSTLVGALQAGARLFFVAQASCVGRRGWTTPARRQAWRDVEGSRARLERIDCPDGKTRLIEPGLKPVADGIPARVGRLRGYGNAIDPRLAAAFIEAYCEAVTG